MKVSPSPSSSLTIQSIDGLEIELPDDIRNFLSHQYREYGDDALPRALAAMKRPPASTICRINQILATREEVEGELSRLLEPYPHLMLQRHDVFDDVLCILPRNHEATTRSDDDMNYTLRHPAVLPRNDNDLNAAALPSFPPSREKDGWPMTHRAVLCDRFCGEAVLRGSDIFVRGILAADAGIQEGETVAVYADIRKPTETAVSHGSQLDRYYQGRCVYLGLGKTACSRSALFRSTQGIGVVMSKDPSQRVGPCLPPLSGVLQDKMMLQNLPSVLVGNVLDPQVDHCILDMCAAPGGKSAHLASLVRNKATIVACDKSRKKMIAAKELFQQLGATCITPLALDSTKCVDRSHRGHGPVPSIQQILDSADVDENYGLKKIKQFPPESFDRILLDPPCSALGLRPKLFVPHTSLEELRKHAQYQQKFVAEAVDLLKPGGIMTYSTCTICCEENEKLVHYILQNYPAMSLLPIQTKMGGPGLYSCGLNDREQDLVRRFNPQDRNTDTMGFFLALFRKADPPT